MTGVNTFIVRLDILIISIWSWNYSRSRLEIQVQYEVYIVIIIWVICLNYCQEGRNHIFAAAQSLTEAPGYLPLCLGLWDLCGVSVAELWQSCGLVITVLSIKYNQLRQNTQSSAMSFITVGLDENKTYNR